LVREMIESPLAAIPLTGRINERELAGMAHGRGVRVAQGEEALLDRNRNLLGKADPDEAAGRQCVAITDELHRLRSGDHLSFLVALEKGQGGMLDHLGSRFRLLHNARLRRSAGSRSNTLLRPPRLCGFPSRSRPTPR
jgi:hypothetical protein